MSGRKTRSSGRQGNSIQAGTGSSTKFFPSLRSLLYNKKWNDAIERVSSHPSEAAVEDKMGDLPLHEVCHLGAPFQVIQKLVHANKSALEKKGFCGRLPLHYAAYSKPSVNVIKLLLQHYPAGSQKIDMDGRLPLHLAVVRNAPKQSIQALIEAHPKALVTANAFGNTPVMLARNEHVAAILEEEANRPRGIKKKMQIEKKLLHDVWNPTNKRNPVDRKKGTSHVGRKLRRVDGNIKAPSVRRDRASTKKHSSRPVKSISSHDSPRSPIGVMSEGTREGIPQPKQGSGNFGGKLTMNRDRTRQGIPPPEKGSGNYGGKNVMNHHRRTHLPSPTRLHAKPVPPAIAEE